MKEITKEWIEKAEGDWKTALKELEEIKIRKIIRDYFKMEVKDEDD